MDNNDARRAALDEEERCIKESLARSMTELKLAQERIGMWITMEKAEGERPPPRDVSHAAFNLQLDVYALYRLRIWRRRFG